MSRQKTAKDGEADYVDPFFVRIAVNRPWPVIVAIGIAVSTIASAFYWTADKEFPPLTLVPIVLVIGVVVYLQCRGMQKEMQGERAKRKRAFQAKYPLIPIAGVVAGAVFFMITRQQGPGDILSYDWSGIFGIRENIEGEEPLPITLADYMAMGGSVALAIAMLWHKFAKSWGIR
ncbi:hypothetical protein [Roseibium sp. SCP14]|uniref:hypothetical protein n=1 Tax=Roseibium sp. SCP14 TaxID=3141375 RepID=UPI003337B2F3